MQLEDATNIWNANASTVNSTNNTVSYTIVSPISFLSVTASDGTSLSNNEFDQTLVQVFPNPTVDWVKISTDLKVETTLFDATGKQLLKTQDKSINFSELSTGMYLFVIKNLDTKNLKTYKIIKQ